METFSGKDTLHDTVGIVVQNKLVECEIPLTEEIMHSEITTSSDDFDYTDESSRSSISSQPPAKRRRTFQSIPAEIKSYIKKPKISEKLLPVNDPLRDIMRNISVDDIIFIERLDLLWVMSHQEKINATPMWVGFNSIIVDDKSPEQKIFTCRL